MPRTLGLEANAGGAVVGRGTPKLSLPQAGTESLPDPPWDSARLPDTSALPPCLPPAGCAPVTFYVDVVVRPHEPLVLVQVVVVHVLDHHEGLLLRWVRVVHSWQGDDGQRGHPGGRGGALAGEELHPARHRRRPRPLRRHRPTAQVLLGRHHPHVKEVAGLGAALGSPPVPAPVVAATRPAAPLLAAFVLLLRLSFPARSGAGDRALRRRRRQLPGAAPETRAAQHRRCPRRRLLPARRRRAPGRPRPRRAAVVGAQAGAAPLLLAELGHSRGDEPGGGGETQHQPQHHAQPGSPGSRCHVAGGAAPGAALPPPASRWRRPPSRGGLRRGVSRRGSLPLRGGPGGCAAPQSNFCGREGGGALSGGASAPLAPCPRGAGPSPPLPPLSLLRPGPRAAPAAFLRGCRAPHPGGRRRRPS